MGELLKLEHLNYTNKIDTKKDHWNVNKFKIINNKKWDKKEYTKAYIKLLTEFTKLGEKPTPSGVGVSGMEV